IAAPHETDQTGDGDYDADHVDAKRTCHTAETNPRPHNSMAQERATDHSLASPSNSSSSSPSPGRCHAQRGSGSNPCDHGRGDSSDCNYCDAGLTLPG